MNYAIPVARGCGSRVQGGVYVTFGLAPGGRPVEDFLIDPPCPVPTDLNLTAIGVKFFKRRDSQTGEEVWHIADMVGAAHYPNVADFIEEVRRFGLSRRIASTSEFSLLGPKSRILLAHKKGYIDNVHLYHKALLCHCLKDTEGHDFRLAEWDAPRDWMCYRHYWQDVQGGTLDNPHNPREVTRVMPAFQYKAMTPPPGVTPQYAEHPAFFMSLPITCLEVVLSNNGEHVDSAHNARQADVPVRIVKQ